ncbi:hypothetical protein F5Y09DRAFT_348008 [Xylaria sp. FL1042]|nr:hypothetical protein F5Y09DRAFT_348008 [Xylaria sp. FL1042]
MPPVPEFLEQLLGSGDYSDLTLVCKGEEFRVHKAIVCSQSPMIATAVAGHFKEARTATMEVDFDLEILKCMLDYMYKGKYDTTPARPTQPTQPVQSTQDAESSEASPAKESKQKDCPTIDDILLHNARVNGIADYYGVADLANLSASTISQVLEKNWSADRFCNLIQKIAGLTADENIRQSLARAATLHVTDLLDEDVFSKGMIANDMAPEVLKTVGSYLKQVLDRLAKTQAEVKAKNDVIANREENLGELTLVLSSLRSCDKRECKKPFGCLIQKPSENRQQENRWLIQCAYCKCRHVYDSKRCTAILASPPPPRT